MKTYDWIIIGAGLTGAAVSYELVKKGFSVLLLDRYANVAEATRYSYGGIAYWSGTTPLTRQLYAESRELYHTLPEELETDIQFRELDLLLTISPGNDPEQVAASVSGCATVPRLLSVEAACELEPLLNKNAIAGALTVRHGHVSPEAITQAYRQAFLRSGGVMQISQVKELIREGARITGVTTTTNETYYGNNTLVCAGGFSRALLKAAGISCRIYFTHAEMLEIAPVNNVQLRTLVMPADMARFSLEAKSTTAEVDSLWDEPGKEIIPLVLEAGAIQFLDNSIRIGQISRFLTDPNAQIDAEASEAEMRAKVGKVLPAIGNLPGTWHKCLVAFSHDRLPLVGAFPELSGVQVFSGFSSPFAIVPAIARRFANFVAGENDEIVPLLSPSRFNVKN